MNANRNFKQIMIFLMIGLVILSTMNISPNQGNNQQNNSNLNIILMIGDGMGVQQIRYARWVEVGQNGSLTIDSLNYIANVTTSSADNIVTDSPAGATAIATGNKTNNGYIGVDPNAQSVETILEYAQILHKSTGLISTNSILDATPAAFTAHVQSRTQTGTIKNDYERSGVNIFLGGGNRHFSSDQGNSFVIRGYEVVHTESELLASNSNKILGTFVFDHFPYVQERNSTIPSLPQMTEKSLEILSQNPNGFFLMVEGARIDHAGHVNNKTNIALEMIEFDYAIRVAKNFVDLNPNTLLIVTADHETGGILNLDSTTLNGTLPSEGFTEAENLSLRIDRAKNVSVTWSASGSGTLAHTDFPVPVYVYGSMLDDLPLDLVADNTDIYPIMKSFFPFPPPTTFLPFPPPTTSSSTSIITSTISSSETKASTTPTTTTASGFEFINVVILLSSTLIFIKRKKR